MRNTYAQQLLCDNAPETVALRIAKPLADIKKPHKIIELNSELQDD